MKVLLSRAKPAFTLFEVLLALALLVGAVSMIANLEYRSLSRVLRDRDEIEKIFLIKKELYTHFFKLPEKAKKIVTKLESPGPEIAIATQIVDVAPKSSLFRLKDKLTIVQTQGRWKIGKDDYDATMIAVAFKPKSDKEKEKK